MRSFLRNAVLMALFAGLVGLAGCPTPKLPKGPPPEYEDPPAPSWLEAGAAAAVPATDAGAKD